MTKEPRYRVEIWYLDPPELRDNEWHPWTSHAFRTRWGAGRYARRAIRVMHEMPRTRDFRVLWRATNDVH